MFASLWLGACGGGTTSCEDRGGVKLRGVCVCPMGSVQVGESCSALDASPANAPADAAAADAANPSAPDATNPAAPDASSDAAAPAPETDDAGSLDAGARTAPGDASVRDASLRCAPQGIFDVTRTRLRGSCDGGLAMFQAVFHGKLSDPYTDEQSCPKFDAGTSDDGCTMSYVQRCDTSTTGYELETGTLTMSGDDPNTIIGNLTVTDYNASGGTTQTLCSSDFLFGAVKH